MQKIIKVKSKKTGAILDAFQMPNGLWIIEPNLNTSGVRGLIVSDIVKKNNFIEIAEVKKTKNNSK